MATSTQEQAGYTAANHFGLGLRPGELNTIKADPRGWLHAQLDTVSVLPAAYQQLDHSQVFLATEAAQRSERRATLAASPGAETSQEAIRRQQQTYQRETAGERLRQADLRMQVAITTEQPFAERLVRFWSNHFTVAVSPGAKAVLRTISLPYENEAIRANLGGDFASLLVAVEQHPAMLIYLDNNTSIGPNSLVGRRRDAGLNENLAREILELHTLGVDGGYTQADVTSLAKMITGWSVPLTGNRRILGRAEVGRFNFVQPTHEPGARQLLGKTYAAAGVEQGTQALADLARHPATARHIATSLACHFVADDPPPAAVATLEQVFLESGGSLPALHTALIELDAAWEPTPRKLKTPEELVVSTARALGIETDAAGNGPRPVPVLRGLTGTLSALNQTPFAAASPAGWPDAAAHWGSPDALLKRIEWTNEIAGRSSGQWDPARLYPQIMPVQQSLQVALSRAESASQGLALLLGSPQFQWR